jgi:hypothetical protein
MKKLALIFSVVLAAGTCLLASSKRLYPLKINLERNPHASSANGFLSRLSLRLWGGYADSGWGDFGRDVQSHDQIYRDLAAAYENGTVTGGHRPSRCGLGGGASLLYSVSKRLSLGLGVEYFRKDTTSSESLRLGWMEKSFQTSDRTIKQGLDLAGILLQVNASFPLIGKLDLLVGAGAGLYRTKVRHDVQWTGSFESWGFGRHIDPSGAWKTDWFRYAYGDWGQTDSIETSEKRLGGSGWLGIRYWLSSRVSLFLEGKALLLKLSGPRAEEVFSFRESRTETAILADLRSWNQVESVESWTAEGKLENYDFFSEDLSRTYSFVTANRTYREQDPVNSNFRPAAVNLNGLQLLLGIELRLF